jgi:hypothetical protein
MLPLRPGIPERQTHDDKRHGATTLFAALEIATGKVTDVCYPRHRHQKFLHFLKQLAKTYPRQELHLVCDNRATHKHPKVKDWLQRNPRITLHFIPPDGLLAEHGRDLLRDHHPPSHPPLHRQLMHGL